MGMAAVHAATPAEFRLMEHLEYWEDQRQTATLDEVRAGPQEWIVNPPGKAPTFGFSRSAFWFRFQLPQDIVDRETLVLLFRYPLTDDIQLYMPEASGGFKSLQAGRNYPIATRSLPTQDLMLEIPLDHQLPNHYFYLRLQTQGSAQFPMDILSFHDYFRHAYKASLPYRIFMGTMLVMILYNIIFYLVTRLATYLIYVIFIMCSTLFVMSLYGLSYLYIWPEWTAFNKISVPLFMAFCNTTVSIFNNMSLQLRTQKRIAYQVLAVDAWVGVLLAMGCFVLPYAMIVRMASVQTMVTSCILPVIYIALCRQRYRPAYFFLLSVGTLAFWALVYGAKSFGILPHNFITESSAMIAAASQATLLTFALADQHREVQKQNAQMQKEMISMQRENIRLLDQKVEEKTHDVRVILSSIQQGIFTISGQPPRIDEEYSQHLASLFPGAEIAGRDPIELLGPGSQLSGDEKDQLRSVILCCLDSHLYNFELNEGLFPRRLLLNSRVLEVEWSPVMRKDESVSKILVAVRDVTRILELEEQKKRIDADFHLMNLVLMQKPERVRHFIRFNQRLLERIRQHTEDSDRNQLKAVLHTLKGNARTFGLNQVANICHQLEDLLRGPHADIQDFLQGLTRIEAILGDLGRAADHVQTASAQEHHHTQEVVLASLERLRAGRPANETANLLGGLVYRELQATVQGLETSLEALARELKKPKPALVYASPSAIFLEENLADLLQSLLIHLLTNAMTHGIESEAERIQKGKPPTGTIRVTARMEGKDVCLAVTDDGRGINLEALRTRAVQQGVLPPGETDRQRIADTIFAAGVSTADQVSVHSGRGVGMTAVRHMLQSLGTDITLVLLGAPDDPWQTIAFTMRFPLASDDLMIRIAS